MYLRYLMKLRRGVSACGRIVRLVAACCLIAAGLSVPAKAAEGDTLRIAVISFLSGPGAESPGIPARRAAEVTIEAINNGALPAPFDRPGVGGLTLEPIFVDQSGGPTRMVTEYRNLVQRRGVDLILGYMSSADCNAVAPVAEELKTLTVFAICSVPVFEENDYRYLFQTSNHATAHSVGLARFVARNHPEARTVAGINQNYAWGRDAWYPFLSSLKYLMPNIEVVDELWPKLFAGQYGAEISSLLVRRPDVLHTSLWGADLQSFTLQATPRGLFQRSTVMFSVGLHVLPLLADQLPDGTVLTTLGPYGQFMPKSAISDWFISAYETRHGVIPGPIETSYAEALLGVKVAFDKAAAAVGGRPSTEDVIAAFEYLEWDGLTGTVRMTLGKGHQAILGIAVGVSRYDPALGQSMVTDIVRFDAECVNPPVGWTSADWIKAGFPGAKCD